MPISEEYKEFIDSHTRNELIDVFLDNDKISWKTFIKSPDDLDELITNCVERKVKYPSPMGLHDFLKDKITIHDFVQLFNKDAQKITEFMNKHRDLTADKRYIIPFKIMNDPLRLAVRVQHGKQEISVPLFTQPVDVQLSKDYKEFEKFRTLRGWIDALRDENLWKTFIKSPDDLGGLIKNCVEKKVNYPSSSGLHDFLRDKITIHGFAQLFNNNVDKITKFMNEYGDLATNKRYIIPFKVMNDPLRLAVRVKYGKQEISVPLFTQPVDVQLDDQQAGVSGEGTHPANVQQDEQQHVIPEEAELHSSSQSSDDEEGVSGLPLPKQEQEQPLDLRTSKRKRENSSPESPRKVDGYSSPEKSGSGPGSFLSSSRKSMKKSFENLSL